jgi:hypothetical protein
MLSVATQIATVNREALAVREFGFIIITATVVTLLISCGGESSDSSATKTTTVTTANVGIDGEGHAEILSPANIIAGQPTRLTIKFTVGESGLAIGGGVSLGLHHSTMWPTVQVAAPKAPGYVTARGLKPDSVTVEFHRHPPEGMFDGKSAKAKRDNIFRKVIIARIANRSLAAGDTITFTLGANSHRITAPYSVDLDNEFRITTDADGNGSFTGIENSPTISIISNAPSHLAASIPAQVKVNEAFDVLIRAEDEFYNVASGFNETVSLIDENGVTLAEDVQLDQGIGKIGVAVGTTGPHRLRLSTRDGQLTGRSNPARSFDELPALKLYWGDIHGHTGVSDGLGKDAHEFFSFGRDVAALDVIALTDHGHPDWEANIKAVQEFYAPHEYVTILAQEAGADPDHMNVYYRGDDTDHISQWQREYPAFYNQINRQYNSGDTPQAMTGPHHFSYDRGDKRYPFGIWDTRSARFVEVYSSHGTSEFPGNDRPLPGAYPKEDKYMQYGLAQGLRFGVIGASDNHDSKPGRTVWGHYPGGLSGFWAEELTRESVWAAMWNYHVYATSLDRIYMKFTIDNQIMGSDLVTTSAVSINAYIIGKTDNLSLEVIRDNQEIHTVATENGLIELSLRDTPDSGDHFYYLRVTQDNGERAWSTPIWIDAR